MEKKTYTADFKVMAMPNALWDCSSSLWLNAVLTKPWGSFCSPLRIGFTFTMRFVLTKACITVHLINLLWNTAYLVFL